MQASAGIEPVPGPFGTTWWTSRRYFALLAVLAVIHMVQAAVLPLAGDEAYYWDISRRGDWSSFDQPLLAIWTMIPFRALLGETALAVRMPTVISSFLIGVFSLALIRRLGGSPGHAARTMLLLQATPLFFLGSAYASTDIAMIAAMTGATVAAIAIAQGEHHGWWWFALAIGLGFVAKHPAILAVTGVGAALAVSRRARRDLATPTPYLAAGFAAACTFPVWIWAVQHDFVNFTFQLAGRHAASGFTLAHVAELLGATAVLASPPLFVALAVAWWRGWHRQDTAWIVTLVVAVTPLVFFGFVGLRTAVGGHWAAPGLVLGVAILALTPAIPRWLISLGVGFGLGIVALLFTLVLAAEPIVGARSGPLVTLGDRLARAYAPVVGNDEVVAEIGRRLRPGELPAAESYTDVHLYAFLSRGKLPMHLAYVGGGKHGLDALYWHTPAALRGRDFLLVTERDDVGLKLDPLFATVERDVDFAVVRGGRTLRVVHFFHCVDLRRPEGVFTRLADAP